MESYKQSKVNIAWTNNKQQGEWSYAACTKPNSTRPFTPPFPLMHKLGIMQLIHFKLNKITTWISNLKQWNISSFSEFFNPSHNLKTHRNFILSSLAILAFWLDLEKSSKTTRNFCMLPLSFEQPLEAFLHPQTTPVKLFLILFSPKLNHGNSRFGPSQAWLS